MAVIQWRILVAFTIIGMYAGAVIPSCACIVIHGTWAQAMPWWQSGGDFYQALSESLYNKFDAIIPFRWSGYNTVYARDCAAYDLAVLILQYDYVVIVAHSHGGNVAIKASMYLADWLDATPDNQQFRIKKLYLLATPVRMQDYAPNMNIIEFVYNIFSYEDMVQPVLGIFGRVFPVHKRIANLSLLIDGKGPGHSQFQNPRLAYFLLGIHQEVVEHDFASGFEKFSFLQPGILALDHEGFSFSYEYDRLKKLAFDTKLQQDLLHKTMRSMSGKWGFDETQDEASLSYEAMEEK